MALAGQEMDKRLSTSVMGLRRGLEEARSLHNNLRAEANELKAFIPVLIQGTVSSIQDALRQQVRYIFGCRGGESHNGGQAES